MNSVVLIPSLNPDEQLPKLVKTLNENGFENILVVNDGSAEEYQHFFDEIESMATVINYKTNRGKGAALKEGIKYIKANFSDCDGVVTADSDGQHSVADIKKISEMLKADSRELILGVRNFDLENIPPKSEFGNKLTRGFFRLLYGIKITDTQTGLRGIPSCLYDWALELSGDRFEYETNMLINTKNNGISIEEVEIQTIYENQNEGTHFNPILDSFKIYKLLLSQFIKFSFSSIICVLIDLGLYALFSKLVFAGFDDAVRLSVSTALARIVSSVVNYSINKNTVFKNKGTIGTTLVKYYVLCILQAFASYSLIHILYIVLRFIDDVIIKIFVDVFLFFISYFIQQKWVFKTKNKNS